MLEYMCSSKLTALWYKSYVILFPAKTVISNIRGTEFIVLKLGEAQCAHMHARTEEN